MIVTIKICCTQHWSSCPKGWSLPSLLGLSLLFLSCLQLCNHVFSYYLVNCGVMLAMFWITTIPRDACSVWFSVDDQIISFVASLISSKKAWSILLKPQTGDNMAAILKHAFLGRDHSSRMLRSYSFTSEL